MLTPNKIVACLCVKNESRYLPGFMRHIDRYVDAFCVLDDGSTDTTLDILRAHPKVEKIIELPVHEDIGYDERGNRERVVRAAADIGADWVLCCDPDERFSKRFLKDLRGGVCLRKKNEEDMPEGPSAYGLRFRELWDGPKQYRDDGIWGENRKYILFPLQSQMTFDFPHQYHTYWHYRELDDSMRMLPYDLYHLKMIQKIERKKRAALYNMLDPELKIQPIGYDYLVDEGDLHLSRIKFRDRYDHSTLVVCRTLV